MKTHRCLAPMAIVLYLITFVVISACLLPVQPSEAVAQASAQAVAAQGTSPAPVDTHREEPPPPDRCDEESGDCNPPDEYTCNHHCRQEAANVCDTYTNRSGACVVDSYNAYCNRQPPEASYTCRRARRPR